MSRLLSLLAGNSAARVLAANNCNLPTSYNTSANWVKNCWTTHISGPSGYTQVEATFVNGLVSTNSEQNAYYDFYLRAGLFLNGSFYPFLFNGSNEILVAKEWGMATGICDAPFRPTPFLKLLTAGSRLMAAALEPIILLPVHRGYRHDRTALSPEQTTVKILP